MQTAQTLLAGLSYYGILKAAYPGGVFFWPVVTAYAVGVAMNGFLPANLGTFVTLLMFVAVIPRCSFAGSLAAYLVQKIFFTLAGTFVYLYMFLSVPGVVRPQLRERDLAPGAHGDHRRRCDRPDRRARAGLLAAGQEAVGEGETRRSDPLPTEALHDARVLAFVPELDVRANRDGDLPRRVRVPVTFESVMWVTGSGSLASVASFTPGGVGVTQATNALALKTCCHVAKSQAIDYSTAQQLIVTGWNQIVAIVLVVVVFGWAGGKQLVGDSYQQAKEKSAEMRAERKRKKLEKRGG